MAVLKAGVIGAGVFGGYHARKYADHPEIAFSAIYDPNAERAWARAEEFGINAFTDLTSFLNDVDIVTIASPASSHFQSAEACLSNGKHLLIEKPIATRPSDGRRLIELAKAQRLVIAVGHQERAVADALGLLDIPDTPLYIEAIRHGPWSERGSDVSVTLDLMTHDLDLVGVLCGQNDIASCVATGRSENSDYLDDVQANLKFQNGRTAKLSASRLAQARERKMRIVYENGEISIDFVTLSVKNSTPYPIHLDFQNSEKGRDSLGYNVQRFICAVQDPTKSPLVTAEDGLRALSWADMIDRRVLGP